MCYTVRHTEVLVFSKVLWPWGRKYILYRNNGPGAVQVFAGYDSSFEERLRLLSDRRWCGFLLSSADRPVALISYTLLYRITLFLICQFLVAWLYSSTIP